MLCAVTGYKQYETLAAKYHIPIVVTVFGTANDLAMCGARPLFLSCALILEEGLPMEKLWRIIVSMKEAAQEAGVQIVTGDSKVVERGKGDGVFINTSGIGAVMPGVEVGRADSGRNERRAASENMLEG